MLFTFFLTGFAVTERVHLQPWALCATHSSWGLLSWKESLCSPGPKCEHPNQDFSADNVLLRMLVQVDNSFCCLCPALLMPLEISTPTLLADVTFIGLSLWIL